MRRIILVFPIIIFGSYFSSAQNNYLPFLTKEEQQLKYRINRLINSEKLDSIDYQIMYQSKVPYQKEDTSIYRSLIMKYIDSLNRTKP